MDERRLLERLSYWEHGAKRTNLPQLEVLTQSILNYLQRILNTRQGSVPLDSQFGLPDFTNGAGVSLTSGSFEEISASIEHMLSKYEPRLSDATVSIDSSDPLGEGIVFSINGTIRSNDRSLKAHLSARLGNNGKVSISE